MAQRYVVIGAGAVGATVAAQLHATGVDTLAVARGANLAALRAGGLRYIRPSATPGGPADIRQVPLAVAAGPDEVTLRPGDVLVLATKAQDAEAVLAAWAWQPVHGGAAAATAGETLPLVLLQNGLDGARAALRRFATVVDAVVFCASTHLRPGEVIAPSAPHVAGFLLGRVPGGGTGDPVVEAIAADLRAGACQVRVVDDIGRWKAGKLLGNLAYNLDALYPPSPRRDEASAALVAEARHVLSAAGIDPAGFADLRAPDGGSPGAAGGIGLDVTTLGPREIPGFDRPGSSTWQSLARGGSVEADYLNGEIVLLARLHGLVAPVNAGVQRRLATAARLGTAPGTLGADDLANLLAGPGAETEPVGVVTAAHPTSAGAKAGAVLVDAKALRDEQASARPPLLLDVRWALGDPHGHDHYRDGHLPGAVYVDLDTELADHTLAAAPGGLAGRHPLPSLGVLRAAARRWGLSAGRPVVVYDDNGGLSAARAWWLLRWAGVADVRILDGALAAWRDAGLPLETGEIIPVPGDIELSGGHLPVLDADEAAALADSGVLLDARAGERYRGEVEPVDPRAGHIPGARSAPTGDNLDAAGRFRSAADLRTRFRALGVAVGADTPDGVDTADAANTQEVVEAAGGVGTSAGEGGGASDGGRGVQPVVGVYCGSGVTAAHEIAALAVVGVEAALYPGSWSAWSSDPSRPVATGPR
ncbi:Thiosulfate sulfurtransferase (Partial match) [Frankia canadensis]|uniref:Thiosulfate sulfurtransferase (Partial match) n=1 Tax=Frankia canadensis TaxID=1836972 RepID=A0A2I2L1Z1_9ACTN|nr:rhodanese-like domain-containing protein [Frankia canadensis]SNQ51940.1 Thiosulfate sulfurtransferase (Partial match) [Frankia canadensis]SOU59230.1 Thiosulfate sulfurtransferase (Partial match) [Frankia canadensis]